MLLPNARLFVCGFLQLLCARNSKIKFEFKKTPEVLKKIGMERVLREVWH